MDIKLYHRKLLIFLFIDWLKNMGLRKGQLFISLVCKYVFLMLDLHF